MPLVFVKDLFAGAVEVTGNGNASTASAPTTRRTTPSSSDTDFLKLIEHLWHIPSHKEPVSSTRTTATLNGDGMHGQQRLVPKSGTKAKTVKGSTTNATNAPGPELARDNGAALHAAERSGGSVLHQLSASTAAEDVEQGVLLELVAQKRTEDPRWQNYCHAENRLLQSLMRLETEALNFQSLFPPDMVTDVAHAPEVADTCPLCRSPLCIEVTLSLSVCCNCGWAQEHMDSSTTVLVFSEASYDFSNPLTRRSNHFDTWISALQGKDKNLPPPAVLKQIMWQLRANNVAPSEVSTLTVQMALRKLRLRKYYDRVQVILCYLTNQGAPQLTLQQELQVKLLFTAASNSFQRNTPEMRRNMIAYSVVLHCICIFLGLDLFKQSFVPMRSREKLNKQAQYMLRICLDLGWNYNILRRELFEQQVQAIESPKKGSASSSAASSSAASSVALRSLGSVTETASKPKRAFQQLRLDMTPVPRATLFKEASMPTTRPLDTLSCIESDDEEDEENIADEVLPMGVDDNDEALPLTKRPKRET
jgi:hypothetical protein